jgi:hypothetical protein
MAELPERDSALLLDMLLATQDAQAFVKGLDEAAFLASRLHQNAVIRSLEIVGEAAGKVSYSTQAAHPEIPWREITGMRLRRLSPPSRIKRVFRLRLQAEVREPLCPWTTVFTQVPAGTYLKSLRL